MIILGIVLAIIAFLTELFLVIIYVLAYIAEYRPLMAQRVEVCFMCGAERDQPHGENCAGWLHAQKPASVKWLPLPTSIDRR